MFVFSAMLAVGCPRTSAPPPQTSGSALVADERPADLGLSPAERRALRGEAQRKLAVVKAEGEADASVARLQGILDVLKSLDGVASSKAVGRDQERSALAALGAWLDTSVEAADRNDASEPDLGPWSRALAAQAAGDASRAVDEGLAALTGLVDAGLDSATLRYRLAEWAADVGDGALAAELFEGAVAVEAGQEWIAEEGPQAAARARNLSLGPDGAALAQGRVLAEQGRWGAAYEVLALLLDEGQDDTVLAKARSLTAQVMAEAEADALQRLARAEQILEGAGPYDGVRELLDTVRALPEGTWSEAEHLRLEGWYRNRVGATTEAERRAQEAGQAATLADARALVVAGKVRASLLVYKKLDGTPLRSTAQKEAREASETLVRGERERAGGLFVAARKLRDPGEKRSALQEVEQILAGLIREFPESAYVDRLRTNLRAVLDELSSI